MNGRSNGFAAFVFKNRGAVLAAPAVALAVLGKPSAFSVTIGLPLAIAGELIRCWAVGYSGATTREDVVMAPELVTAGPYAYVRNPLYVGNFMTAAGFAIAFTGANDAFTRSAVVAGSLGIMAGVYATIIPYEERYLAGQFGAAYEQYCADVPRVVPALEPASDARGSWNASVIGSAERNTFVFFGLTLAALGLKALKA